MNTSRIAIIISPNWRDYAKKYLADCLASLRQQDYLGETKIFLIDNESTDESYNYLKTLAPETEIIRNLDNAGFAKGNNAAMSAALEQGFDHLILFNMDTEVEPNTVSEMVKAAETDEKIGAVQARLMLYQNKNRINSLGNQMHYLGFGYCQGYNDKWESSQANYYKTRSFFYPSGASVLYKTEALREVGLFDEEFWMYGEDLDLGWRLWLCGWHCILAPAAVVYHKYDFNRSIKQVYWMNRNRLLALFKNYHSLTLLVLSPALILMEIFLLIVSFPHGWWRDAGRLYAYFFRLSTWRNLAKSRREVQKKRKIKDRDIIQIIIGRVKYQEINSQLQTVGNFFFNLYWRIIKNIIIW